MSIKRILISILILLMLVQTATAAETMFRVFSVGHGSVYMYDNDVYQNYAPADGNMGIYYGDADVITYMAYPAAGHTFDRFCSTGNASCWNSSTLNATKATMLNMLGSDKYVYAYFATDPTPEAIYVQNTGQGTTWVYKNQVALDYVGSNDYKVMYLYVGDTYNIFTTPATGWHTERIEDYPNGFISNTSDYQGTITANMGTLITTYEQNPTTTKDVSVQVINHGTAYIYKNGVALDFVNGNSQETYAFNLGDTFYISTSADNGHHLDNIYDFPNNTFDVTSTTYSGTVTANYGTVIAQFDETDVPTFDMSFHVVGNGIMYINRNGAYTGYAAEGTSPSYTFSLGDYVYVQSVAVDGNHYVNMTDTPHTFTTTSQTRTISNLSGSVDAITATFEVNASIPTPTPTATPPPVPTANYNDTVSLNKDQYALGETIYITGSINVTGVIAVYDEDNYLVFSSSLSRGAYQHTFSLSAYSFITARLYNANEEELSSDSAIVGSAAPTPEPTVAPPVLPINSTNSTNTPDVTFDHDSYVFDTTMNIKVTTNKTGNVFILFSTDDLIKYYVAVGLVENHTITYPISMNDEVGTWYAKLFDNMDDQVAGDYATVSAPSVVNNSATLHFDHIYYNLEDTMIVMVNSTMFGNVLIMNMDNEIMKSIQITANTQTLVSYHLTLNDKEGTWYVRFFDIDDNQVAYDTVEVGGVVVVPTPTPTTTSPGGTPTVTVNPYGGNNVLPPLPSGVNLIGIFSNVDPLVGFLISLAFIALLFVKGNDMGGSTIGAVLSFFGVLITFGIGLLAWWIVLILILLGMGVIVLRRGD